MRGFGTCAATRLPAASPLWCVFGHIQPFSSQDDAAIEHERRYFADASRRARLASALGSRYWLVANLLFRQTLLVNSACLIRRECIAELNGYDTELGLNEDVDFYCRAIRRFGFEFLDRVAVSYRILPDSPDARTTKRSTIGRVVQADVRTLSGLAWGNGATGLEAVRPNRSEGCLT